ncbi:MAG TPA: hypothetical protein VKD08_00345 [Ignavibacteriaceae bacterium]|nr:hypothetical protein [Ignavibacteriaceae bacterium]
MAENQSLGEIITRDTAVQEFGQVGISVLISSDLLQSISEMTTDLLMFNIIEEKLVILGDKRKILYPEGFLVPAETVFKVYSKTKVLELIESGGSDDNFVEFRGDNLTITNSDSTLEFGSLCPPYCDQA